MALRRGAGTTTQHELVAHELAVVFADQAFPWPVTGVRVVIGLRPFPHIAQHLGWLVPAHLLLGQRVESGHLDKIARLCAGVRQTARGQFPFKLGRQTRASPARQCIGFKITEVARRRIWVDLQQPLQREMAVAASIHLPVKRKLPLPRLHPVPSHGQPQFGATVASVGHEFHHLAIGDQPAGQLERRHIGRVARGFVVKRKFAVQRGVKAMFDQAAVIGMPAQRLGRGARQRPVPGVGRVLRVERQRMLDVGQQQFLVLLLMVQAQVDELRQFRALGIPGPGNDVKHARIDLRPVGQHFIERRAADQAPLRARILVAHAVVVAVEQDAKTGVKGLELALEAFQYEGFKKPGQVRQMPFGRAGVGHGLKLAVFGA